MSYEEMKELMAVLDKYNIPYEFGNNYGVEWYEGEDHDFIRGHYLTIFGCEIETDEIDDKDERWNRG